MENEINTRRDSGDYGQSAYQPDRVSDANNLYDAWLAAKKGSDWKAKVQIFEMDWLSNIAKLQKDIQNRTYKPQKATEFTIRERGKVRHIHGEQIKDRVLEHSLNDNVVLPAIRPHLIYDNAASLPGKGISFSRKRLVTHLSRFYREHGNNGYILLLDFEKYYENIDHDKLMALFRKYIDDDTALWLLQSILDTFDRGMDIGNQTSQSAGILYPSVIDDYIKTVCGVEFYARYNDDSYVIHESKEFLENLLERLKPLTKENGIVLSKTKTRIVPLSGKWRYLQTQYSLTDSGRIMAKINTKRVTVMRRKIKKLAPKLPSKEYHDWIHSWIKSQRKYLSNAQYANTKRMEVLSWQHTK